MVLALLGAVFLGAMPQLGSGFLGIEYVDHYGTQWFYWFAEHALLDGADFAHTDLFFHPWGKDVYGHTGANVLDAVLAIPFRALLGPALGYNVFVLLGLAGSAAAFWWLSGELVQDRVARLAGTAAYALGPFLLIELVEGRPTQGIVVLPVLCLMFLLRTSSRRGVGWPLLAGLFLALTGLQYWFYAFFLGVAALALGVVRSLRPPADAGGRLRVFGRFALAGGVSLVLVLPFALSLAQGAESGAVPGLLDTARWTGVTSPPITEESMWVGMYLWQPLRYWAGFYIQNRETGIESFLASAVWVPAMVWPLLVVWLWRPGRWDRWTALSMGGVATLLAMGPIVLVGESLLPNWPYILLADALPFVRRLWWPGRAFVVVGLVMGLGVVVALATLARRWGRPVQVGAVALLLGSTGWELHGQDVLPMPTWSAQVPAGYRCLAGGPPGAVLELPFNWTQAHLWYQTAHKRPIFGGMLEDNTAFTPAETQALLLNNSFVSSLLTTSAVGQTADAPAPEDKAALHALGYRYVLLQKDAYAAHRDQEESGAQKIKRTQLRRMGQALGRLAGPPVYSDRRVALYAPWGDPSPCADAPPEADSEAVGLPVATRELELAFTPEDQVVSRWWAPTQAQLDAALETELGTTPTGGLPAGAPKSAE